MKKIAIVSLAGFLFLTACENTGSSTVGSYEKEETSQSFEKNEGDGHGAAARESAGGTAHGTTESAAHSTSEGTPHGTADTLHTSGDAPTERSGVEVKTGANVSVDTANSKAAPNH